MVEMIQCSKCRIISTASVCAGNFRVTLYLDSVVDNKLITLVLNINTVMICT